MERILYLSYYWPPSGGPGVQRALKFVKYFPQFDIDPYLITVNEKKASYPLLDESLIEEVPEDIQIHKTDSFEPLEIYRRLNKKKEIPYSGFVNMDKNTVFQKISRFIRGNFFIPDARIDWKKYAVRQCLKLIDSEEFRAIVTTSPPHSTQLAGLKIKKETGLKWIADLRDPWTDIYYYKDFYHLPFAKKKDAAYEREVLEVADRILVTSRSTKELFLSKSEKINPDKIVVIPNGFDETDFSVKSDPSKKEFVITYSGTITESYQIDEFLVALTEFLKVDPDFPLKLVFVGKISENIKHKIKFLKLHKYVKYVGYVSHKQSIRYLMRSTILFMASPNVERNEGVVPGKLFEYLAARKPILFIGPRNSDVARIIEECYAGRNFDYTEGMRMYSYVDELARKWERSKNMDLKRKIYQKYSRRELTKVFAQIIKEL